MLHMLIKEYFSLLRTRFCSGQSYFVVFCKRGCVFSVREAVLLSLGNIHIWGVFTFSGNYISIFWAWCHFPINTILFFLKFFGGHESFCGATDTPVLDFWWCLPWVSKPGWIPHLRALSPVCHEFLRFTSGATPADCIAWQPAAFHTCYICSRGRLPGFDLKTSHIYYIVSGHAVHSATATGWI